MIEIRISEVKMQKSDTNQAAKIMRRQVGASTTLNRKYVKRPIKSVGQGQKIDFSIQIKTKPRRSDKICHFSSQSVKKVSKQSEASHQTSHLVKPHPTQIIANQRLRERQRQNQTEEQAKRIAAKELKDQAIKKALANANKTPATENQLTKMATETPKKTGKIRFGFGRVILALSCAAAAIFAIIYFVSLNMPDIQFRAVAAQLNATYPNYLPANYTPSSISSENEVAVLTFNNESDGGVFTITEEKLAWDSNSLLNNFVKKNYEEDYATIREQGITIYIGENKAAWVNGGIVYKLDIKKGSLSKKQISSIAVSF